MLQDVSQNKESMHTSMVHSSASFPHSNTLLGLPLHLCVTWLLSIPVFCRRRLLTGIYSLFLQQLQIWHLFLQSWRGTGIVRVGTVGVRFLWEMGAGTANHLWEEEGGFFFLSNFALCQNPLFFFLYWPEHNWYLFTTIKGITWRFG